MVVGWLWMAMRVVFYLVEKKDGRENEEIRVILILSRIDFLRDLCIFNY